MLIEHIFLNKNIDNKIFAWNNYELLKRGNYMEEKKFITPLLEVVDFANDDIITLSNRGNLGDFNGDPNADTWNF